MEIFKDFAMIEPLYLFSFWASVVITLTVTKLSLAASLTIKQEQQDLLFTSSLAIFTSFSSFSQSRETVQVEN